MQSAILYSYFIFVVNIVSAFTETNQIMPRGVLKENLPTKICIVCDRPFTWRKKWERVWDEVATCSKSCNRKRKSSNRSDGDRRHDNNSGTTVDKLGCADDSMDLVGGVMDISIAADDDAKFHYGETIAGEDKGEERNIQTQPDEDILRILSSNCMDEDEDEDGDSDATSQLCTTNIDNTFTTAPSELFDDKAKRKAERKRRKAERRAQKMGQGDPTAGQKRCKICTKSVNLLIRCTYDSSGVWVSAFGCLLCYYYSALHTNCNVFSLLEC